MKGCRPLTNNEVILITEALVTTRDKCLFTLGLATGFRISELVSLKVKNVWQNGKPANRANVNKANTKGKIEGRSQALNARTQQAIADLVNEQGLKEDDYLFQSRKSGPIGRKQAWKVLKDAYRLAEVMGQTGTHSMRKTLAKAVYEASGKNILYTQKILGHKSLNSTTSYLATDQNELDNLVMGIDVFKAG